MQTFRAKNTDDSGFIRPEMQKIQDYENSSRLRTMKIVHGPRRNAKYELIFGIPFRAENTRK